MNKNELLQEINKLQLSNIYGLVSFQTEDLNKEDAIFFQFFASSHHDLRKFVNFNFKLYSIKNIIRYEVTKFGNVIVYLEK